MRPEGSIPVRVQVASAPSMYEHLDIQPSHQFGETLFPSCKLRLKGSESLNIMTLSSMTVVADSVCRVLEKATVCYSCED